MGRMIIKTDAINIRFRGDSWSTESVFVLGAPRTGTTSISLFLKDCGISTVHFYPDECGYSDVSSFGDNFARFSKFVTNSGYNGFADHPTRVLWREIVANFPQARFIMTVRSDTSKWLASANRYFNSISGNHDISNALVDYVSSNAMIVQHFKNENLPLLVLNIDEDSQSNAAALKAFLDVEGPSLIASSNSENERSDIARASDNILKIKDIVPKIGKATWQAFAKDSRRRPRQNGNGYRHLVDKGYVVILTPGISDYLFSEECVQFGLGYPYHFLNSGFWEDCNKVMPGLNEVEFRNWVYSNYRGYLGCIGIISDIYRAIQHEDIAPIFSNIFAQNVYGMLLHEDLLVQAFAFFRSEVSGIWGRLASRADPRLSVSFDGPRILSALQEIIRQEWLAAQWFAEIGAAPRALWQGDFVSKPGNGARALARKLRLVVPQNVVVESPVGLESELDPHWRAEFRAMYPWVDELIAIRPDWARFENGAYGRGSALAGKPA